MFTVIIHNKRNADSPTRRIERKSQLHDEQKGTRGAGQVR